MTTNKPGVINVYSTSFIGALDCVRLSDYEAMKSAYEEELFCVRQDRDAHFGELIRAIEQTDALKDLLKMYKSALNKWAEKSEWVREEVVHSEIRMHRADVMKSRIEALQAECRILESELATVKKVAYGNLDLLYGCEKLAEALEQIERWDGFPSTGKTWEGSGEPVSYGAAFGSNGERDFMRKVARKALDCYRQKGDEA